MDNEERVQVLEGEFKLLKSQVKQTLSTVRDFLMDFKIPAPPEAKPTPIEQDINSNDESTSAAKQEQPVDQSPSDDNNAGSGDFNEPDSAYSEPEPDMSPAMGNADSDLTDSADEDPSAFDAEDTGISSGEMPSAEEPQDEVQKPSAENLPASVPEPAPATAPAACANTTPQVNMLANLIRWAAEARREIGMAQLPVFLDVYATSGHLTEEMKESILHLAEVAVEIDPNEIAGGSSNLINEQITICMEIGSATGDIPAEIRTRIRRLSELILKQNTYSNKADIWSQMMLKLHGILINSGSPAQPISFAKSKAKEESALEKDVVKDAQLEGGSADEEEDADFFSEDNFSEGAVDIEEEPEEEDILPPVRNVRPAKLRLVMPVGDGAEQELDLGNLFIAADPNKKSNGHKKASTPKR